MPPGWFTATAGPRDVSKRKRRFPRRVPQHWYGRQAAGAPAHTDARHDQEVSGLSRRKAWARLLAKVYELDVMACPKCGSRMSAIALLLDPAEIRKIIACLSRHGRGPPTEA